MVYDMTAACHISVVSLLSPLKRYEYLQAYVSQLCKGGHDKKHYSPWQDLLLIGLFPYLTQNSGFC